MDLSAFQSVTINVTRTPRKDPFSDDRSRLRFFIRHRFSAILASRRSSLSLSLFSVLRSLFLFRFTPRHRLYLSLCLLDRGPGVHRKPSRSTILSFARRRCRCRAQRRSTYRTALERLDPHCEPTTTRARAITTAWIMITPSSPKSDGTSANVERYGMTRSDVPINCNSFIIYSYQFNAIN